MKLAQSLNRTVLVAIPAFFGDDGTRTCTLIEVESAGLWLACEELRNRLGPAAEISTGWTAAVTGFFPFTQILYVVDPVQFATLARGSGRPTPSGSTTQPDRGEGKREHPRHGGTPKHKNSKGRR
jgi:hypothetical protein